jgi:DNA-binding response OmpR family regulator
LQRSALVPPTRRKKKTTVLVVEDDPVLRQLYRSVMTLEGYIVVSAEDGVEALRQIDIETPDLVVLDLGLPRLSGGDVRRELAAHAATEHIPVVVVTGAPDGLEESDFACVLKKPIDPRALLAAIANCLRKQN